MKKELFKILEDYTLKDVPTEVKEDMIKILNTEGTEFNSFLIQALGMLTDVIEGLEEGNSIVATSVIDVILAIEYSAKNIVVLIEQEKEEIKILPSEKESILINAKSILNAVDIIRNLQAERLKELTPEELLIALTT